MTEKLSILLTLFRSPTGMLTIRAGVLPFPMLRYDFQTDRNQNSHWKGHRPKGPTHSGFLHSLSRKILRITERTPVPILKNAAGAALKCGARLSKMWRASRFHVVCTTFYPAVIPWIATRSDLFIQELSAYAPSIIHFCVPFCFSNSKMPAYFLKFRKKRRY